MPRARLAVLLKHFSQIDDDREPWRVVYPLAEVLLLLTCATIASCDDFEDIVAWGEQHLDLLRRFSEFHFGIPCVRWLQTLVNRVDPVLLGRCFERLEPASVLEYRLGFALIWRTPRWFFAAIPQHSARSLAFHVHPRAVQSCAGIDFGRSSQRWTRASRR